MHIYVWKWNLVYVWIELIFAEIENWKHYSKIIFKCVNSIVRPVNSVFCPLHSKIMWYYCSRIVVALFIYLKILKMGPIILFTHLKIILLQCFQFSISAKISSIQTNSVYIFYLLRILWMNKLLKFH